MMRYSSGFTLVELMIVVAIIAFLSMIAVPGFFRFLAKAKRAEAYMHLGAIYASERSYWAEHGKYSAQLAGVDGVGWQPEGYKGNHIQEKFTYTYGFAEGSEGSHHFTGKLGASPAELKGTHAEKNSFIAAAVGDIDGDGYTDLLTVNELNDIVITQDDLA